MKTKIYINSLLSIIFIVFFTACASEDVEIKTLSKYGEQFYFGEKVVLWAGSDTKNVANVTYSWECDGGTFTGPQYLFENLWIAPKVPGEYTVRVTAKVGNNTSTKEAKMKVNYYFFDNFVADLSVMNLAGWTFSGTGNVDLIQQKVKCVATSTSGTIKKLLPDTLNFPFSVFSNAGFETINSAGNSYIQYRLFFQLATDLSSPYIREIRWQFLPNASGTTKNLKIQYETYQPNTAKSIFYDILPDGVNTLGSMTANSYEDFSMSIAADTMFYAIRNGHEVCKSDAIRTWLRAHPTEKPVCNQINWTFSGPSTTMWFDNFYIVNDGSVLATKPE